MTKTTEYFVTELEQIKKISETGAIELDQLKIMIEMLTEKVEELGEKEERPSPLNASLAYMVMVVTNAGLLGGLGLAGYLIYSLI